MSIGKFIKRILKPFVLAILRGAEKEVETNWQRKKGFDIKHLMKGGWGKGPPK